MRGGSGIRERRPADDILDYAMLGSLAMFVTVTTGLLQAGAPLTPTIVFMGITGVLVTFTIIPHLIALWLDEDINALLQITDSTNSPPPQTSP